MKNVLKFFNKSFTNSKYSSKIKIGINEIKNMDLNYIIPKDIFKKEEN